MDNLEQVANPEEQPKESSKQEKPPEPSKESKDTSLKKTYSEEQYKKAQVSWDREISLQKLAAERAKTEAEQLKADRDYFKDLADTERLAREKEAEGQLAEDPIALRGYKDTERIKRWERDVERREARAAKIDTAYELSSRYEIPYAELISCNSPSDMYNKAIELVNERAKSQTVESIKSEPKETEPQFDQAISTGEVGASFAQLEQRYADGEISFEEYNAARKREGLL